MVLKSKRKVVDPDNPEEEKAPAKVSAGNVDKVIDLAFNPTRDKIREVTIVDRIQGRLFPQLDMINTGLLYCIEIAFYRFDPEQYAVQFKRRRPMPPNLMDEFIYRTAQWQKSIAGKNLERATDIALAETEAKAGNDDDMTSAGDPFE